MGLSKIRFPLSICICLFGIGLPTALGIAWPAYSPISNYLSELGALGAPNARIMSYAGFLTVGVLWSIGVWSLIDPSRGRLLFWGLILLLGTSVSYIGAAFFPCDLGCPLEGSNSQLMHNILGIVGYLTAPPGLALIGTHFVKLNLKFPATVSFAAAATTFFGLIMMFNPEAAAFRGAWQRLADFSLFIWLLAISASLRRGA